MSHDEFSLDEMHSIIGGLTTVDLARLRRAGRLFALGLACEGDELISEAIAATLSGARKCPRRMATVPFLIGAMRSIASASRGAAVNVRKVVSLDATGTDGRPIVVLVDSEPTIESRLLAAEEAAQRINALERLFANDEQASLMMLADLEFTPKEEIMNMLDLDDTAYATVRRRMRRAINGRYPAGWTA